MKNLLLAAVVACLAVPAWAYSPGDKVPVTSTVLCDTLDQMHSLLEAGQTGPQEAMATYRSLLATESPHGGPACAFIPPGRVVAIKFIQNLYAMDNVSFDPGVVGTLWIIEVEYTINGVPVRGFIFADDPLTPPGEPA